MTPSPSPKPVDYIASFEIIEKGRKKDFDDPKYFNLNTDAYISPLDPQFIHLKKTGLVWKDFFAIHKIEIKGKPTLTLNSLENKEALDKEITPGAKLLIEYK